MTALRNSHLARYGSSIMERDDGSNKIVTLRFKVTNRFKVIQNRFYIFAMKSVDKLEKFVEHHARKLEKVGKN